MADDFQRYVFVRGEIAREDGLIAHRLSWFLGSQSFLLSGLAIAHEGGTALPAPGNNFLFPLLPCVGIATTLVLLASILAGLRALGGWRKIMRREFSDASAFPALPSAGCLNFVGALSPVLLPLIFLAAWSHLLRSGLAGG